MCQDQKDLTNEIKNSRHAQMLNVYPKEFVNSVMKSLRSNRPSSDTIYQGTVKILKLSLNLMSALIYNLSKSAPQENTYPGL
jgi:hypothetical protein